MPKKVDEDIIRNVGRRVAELRRDRMTQAQFAERIGSSVQWVSRVEVGENLTLTTLEKIAKALGVEIISLFEPPARGSGTATRGRPRARRA